MPLEISVVAFSKKMCGTFFSINIIFMNIIIIRNFITNCQYNAKNVSFKCFITVIIFMRG